MFEGGYYIIPEPLVRGFGVNAHTARNPGGLSDYSVEAVNLIQDTPWKVNKFVLWVVSEMMTKGKNLVTGDGGDIVLMIEAPQDPRTDPDSVASQWFTEGEWGLMSREAKKEFKKRKAKVLTRFEEDLGIYRATKRIFEMAQEMNEFDRFYFPHNMDFRTRIYPIPTDLNPQSSDFSKGLLEFSRGTRLGEEGLFWLGFTAASHWGQDKLHPAERVDFAMLRRQEWESYVDDPLTYRGWLDADKPFQFLAAAYEWVWAHRTPEGPEHFISYLPGNLDGSCNGAQHLSIMARDEVGALATNCCSIQSRKDLYMEVADRVWDQVQEDIEDGSGTALEWYDKMSDPKGRRKVVKRSVMTVPYGVTDYGVAEFMISDGHVKDEAENQWDSAKFMRDLIMDSIDRTLEKGRGLQLWFSRCAQIVAEAGLPLEWDTPAGSKVTQAYRNVVARRIRALDTQFIVYAEPEEDEDDEDFLNRVGMNVSKMVTAAPPNVVHSCDASHLQITTVRMAQAGIRDFSMIHDSFGCPMAYVGLMRDILRQSIVDMYQDDYLQRWKESVERYSGLKMPEPPEVGTFDVQQILTSEFFFS